MIRDKEWLKNEMLNLRNASNRVMVVAIGEVMDLIDQLDEPVKVVIPQFVADWIEGCRSRALGLSQVLDYDNLDIMPHEMKEYIKYNFAKLGCGHNQQELVAKAWLDGYEVEKEKLYWVIIPTKGEAWRYYYLDGFGGIYMTDDLKNVERHTEAFIRSVSDDLWQFAVEVAE